MDVIFFIFFMHAMNLMLWSIPSNVMNMDIVRSWSSFFFPPMVVVFHPCCEMFFMLWSISSMSEMTSTMNSSRCAFCSPLNPLQKCWAKIYFAESNPHVLTFFHPKFVVQYMGGVDSARFDFLIQSLLCNNTWVELTQHVLTFFHPKFVVQYMGGSCSKESSVPCMSTYHILKETNQTSHWYTPKSDSAKLWKIVLCKSPSNYTTKPLSWWLLGS